MHYDSSEFVPSSKLINGVLFAMGLIVVIGITQFASIPLDESKPTPVHFTLQNVPHDFSKKANR